MSGKPTYAVGYVPVEKVKRNWREYFKTPSDYESWVVSGMYHVYFAEDDEEIRLWYLEQKEALKAKQEYVENTRLDNYVASMRLEGMNKEKED
jgi:hypothetical protein